MAKKQKPEGKKYNYMDTYGDLVTLLLCFFVLLFSMSTVEENRYNIFVEALSAHFGTNTSLFSNATAPADGASGLSDGQETGDSVSTDESMPADLSSLMSAIENFVSSQEMAGAAGAAGGVTVEQSASGATFIRLPEELVFEGNSDILRPTTKEFLDFLGEAMISVDSEILQVRFIGHTASQAGSTVDDWVLSGSRAAKVSSYFSNIVGFDRFKIQLVGFGRNFPIADNTTAEGRALNRRVDIVVLSNNPDTMKLTLLDAMRVYFPSDSSEHFEGNADSLPDNLMDNIDPADLGSILEGLSEEQWRQIQDIINEKPAASEAAAPQQTNAEQATGEPAAGSGTG